jgi:hypothetical protein
MLIVYTDILSPEHAQAIQALDPRASYWPSNHQLDLFFEVVPVEWNINFTNANSATYWLLLYSAKSSVVKYH